MRQGTTVTVEHPAASSQDVLTEILRAGARKLLAEAVEAEVDEWIDRRGHLRNEQGRRQGAEGGRLPQTRDRHRRGGIGSFANCTATAARRST